MDGADIHDNFFVSYKAEGNNGKYRYYKYTHKDQFERAQKLKKIAITAFVVIGAITALFAIAALSTFLISFYSAAIISALPVLAGSITWMAGTSHLFPIVFGSVAAVALFVAILVFPINHMRTRKLNGKKEEIIKKEFENYKEKELQASFDAYKEEGILKAYNELSLLSKDADAYRTLLTKEDITSKITEIIYMYEMYKCKLFGRSITKDTKFDNDISSCNSIQEIQYLKEFDKELKKLTKENKRVFVLEYYLSEVSDMRASSLLTEIRNELDAEDRFEVKTLSFKSKFRLGESKPFLMREFVIIVSDLSKYDQNSSIKEKIEEETANIKIIKEWRDKYKEKIKK